MAAQAEKLNINANPQIQPEVEREPERKQPVKIKSRADAYSRNEENRLSKMIWSVIVSALIVIVSVCGYMYVKGKAESRDNDINKAGVILYDARENYNELNSYLQKLITPDKLADYADAIQWVKIPDSNKLQEDEVAENRLETTPQE